ncbi:MAG: hypothetical protein L3J74_00670, partial [Bacteroidales bacterium]|nr:hypothetical protein [Bacteroidales bacterium]
MKNIKNLQTAIFLFGFLLFSTNILAQIYVKADATGSNDGTSWTNAYTNLQSALSAATAGNEIWVAAGTYKPTAGTDRLSTFLLKANVPLYGGFFGNESNLSERNYIANQTILSGDIGTDDYNADNVYHVVYGDNSAYIDGFIIEGGNADDVAGGITYGGGLAVTTTDADMTVKNCVFRNNYAEINGAAISIASDNSNTNKFRVENCIFTNNSTPLYTGKGGAISLGLANITVVNSVFKGNVARYGTAVYNGTEYNSATKHANFINCTFFETNNAYPEIYDNYQASSFTNCIFNVKNSIFFNNDGTAKAIVNYSCINPDNLDTDTYTGSNNIFIDPLFLSDETLQLQALSPCIDNANGDSVVSPDYFGSPVYDNPLISNTGVGTPNYADMGANEFYTDKMIGYYTIGSTGDYANFTAAINDLNTLGVGGPVIFNVQSGTYNEQIIINEVAGASETNTITFQSESGDSTDVILSYAANSTNNYTVKLNGADFIRFKNMTLQATDNTYARIVELSGGACQNHFSNNQFIGVSNSSELVYSYNTSNQTADIDTNNVFVYNRFTNGQRAISLTTNLYHLSTQTNISIHHNEFNNQTDKAVYLNYCSHSSIKNNSFTSNTSSTGIYLDEFSSGDTISSNNIQLNSGGIGIDINHCYRVSNDTSLVYNNFIYLNTTNADIGINIYSTYTALKVLYNTINITGNNTGSVAIKKDAYVSSQKTPVILNNIFSNKANGLASWFNYSVNSDYNCFYTTGQYLINNNSLESWQDSQNQDANSVQAKPYFIADNNWQAENLKLNGSATLLTDVNT